jgi:hypothetical protein
MGLHALLQGYLYLFYFYLVGGHFKDLVVSESQDYVTCAVCPRKNYRKLEGECDGPKL